MPYCYCEECGLDLGDVWEAFEPCESCGHLNMTPDSSWEMYELVKDLNSRVKELEEKMDACEKRKESST